MLEKTLQSKNQKVQLPILKEKGVELWVKREDKLHPHISGNKYRKLKYNLIEASKQQQNTLLTFGGAFSNHIAAVAAAGKEFGFKTIGVIRGEELQNKIEDNPTLKFAESRGMHLHFVSRTSYRKKTETSFLQHLKEQFGEFYTIPEGGTNKFAVKGCEEILTKTDTHFSIICCAVGTGGTISGLINCSQPSAKVLGFPALKGDFLKDDICKFAQKDNWELINDYHFGGYAKVTQELISFINWFKEKTGIQLDPIYTGKMMFGILELVKNGYFKEGTTIIAVHTGGLQGIEGMNNSLHAKNLPLINV